MLDSFKITVLEVLEAAWGFRVKAKDCAYVCVGLRGKMCLRVAEWTFVVFPHLGSLFFSCIAFLSSSQSSHRIFTPPAQNPFPLCVHHRSRSSRQSDLRGWASLLQGKESHYGSVHVLFGLMLQKTVSNKKQSANLAWGFVCTQLQRGRRCRLSSVRRNIIEITIDTA